MDDAEQADELRVQATERRSAAIAARTAFGQLVGRGRSVAAVVPARHRRLLVVMQVGRDLAGVDEREPDAGVGQLVPQRLAERPLGRLRRAVDGGVGEGAHRRAGGDDRDVTVPGGDHRLQRRTDGPDGPEPVDRRHPLDQLRRQLAERAVVGDAGIGDDQLQPAGRGDEARDRRLDRRAVGDVARQRGRDRCRAARAPVAPARRPSAPPGRSSRLAPPAHARAPARFRSRRPSRAHACRLRPPRGEPNPLTWAS